jgi:hypothetical protein
MDFMPSELYVLKLAQLSKGWMSNEKV